MPKTSRARLTVKNLRRYFGLTNTEEKILLNRYDDNGVERSQREIAEKVNCADNYVYICMKKLPAKLMEKKYTIDTVLQELGLLKIQPARRNAKTNQSRKRIVAQKSSDSQRSNVTSQETAAKNAESAVTTTVLPDKDYDASLNMLGFAGKRIGSLAGSLGKGSISSKDAAMELEELCSALQSFLPVAAKSKAEK